MSEEAEVQADPVWLVEVVLHGLTEEDLELFREHCEEACIDPDKVKMFYGNIRIRVRCQGTRNSSGSKHAYLAHILSEVGEALESYAGSGDMDPEAEISVRATVSKYVPKQPKKEKT